MDLNNGVIFTGGMEQHLPFEHALPKVLVKRDAATDLAYGCDPQKRSAEVLMTYGVVNINKPKGPTSHMVSDYVQKILKIEKAGHSGTLDPGVTGVLPIAIGRATRIVQTLLTAGKEYVCVMHVHKPVAEQEVRKTIQAFVGKIMQLPPVRSAVVRQVRERTIYYLDVLEIKDQDVLFRVGCQAGTYIRKLCLHPKTEILSQKGIIPAEEFYTRPQRVYSFYKNKMVKKQPSAVQILHSPRRLVEISTSSGISFIVTEDHKLLTASLKNYKMTEAKRLNKKTYLVKSMFLPIMRKNYLIPDLLDENVLIPQQDIKEKCKQAFITKYGSIRAMNLKLKLDRKTFLSKSKSSITIKHLKLARIYDAIKHKIDYFKTEKGRQVNLKGLNTTLLYLLGLIASDGNNTKEKNTIRHTRIKFHNTNEELINVFCEHYKILFPNIPISKKKINHNLFQLDTSNSILATLAASLGIKSPHKHSDILPILYLKSELISAFLRGYFDGDGTCYFHKKSRVAGHYTDIRLFTVNYTNAKRLHQMLLKINITNKIFHKNNYYIISLESLPAKLAFIRNVGSNHPEKKKKMLQISGLKIKGSSNDHLHIGFQYKNEIRRNKKHLQKMGGNLYRLLNGSMPITRGFYKKAGKIVKLPPLEEFVIEKIKSVKFLTSNVDYVYDMTIPRTHNFLIETGFVSSNCHDIGYKLKVGAHMAELIRTKAGPFGFDTVVTLQDLQDAVWYWHNEKSDVLLRKCIVPVEHAVQHVPKIWIQDSAVDSMCHGALLNAPGVVKLDDTVTVDHDVAIMTLKNELVALGRAKKSAGEIMKQDAGCVAGGSKVFMLPSTYPKMKRD